MSVSYDFVPFLKCKPYIIKDEVRDGIIPITIKTLTPVHMHSGGLGIDQSKKLYKSFIKINDKFAIPGTSLKGMARSIAEAISYSCYRASGEIEEEKVPYNLFDKGNNCIACDMFGSMGRKSKIQFGDCYIANGKSEIIGLPASFSPRPRTSLYLNNQGKYKGRKFYKHGILGLQQKGDIRCECVLENAQFHGEVRFNGLTDEQIQLLCFSLGLSGDIHPKIGFGKNHFYGSVSISSDEEWATRANDYKSNANTNILRNITKIIEILSFNNAVESLE